MASSSQTTPHSKKGKRKSTAVEAEPEQAGDVRVIVGEASSSAGPAFVNYPSVRPGKETPWTIYTRDVGSAEDITKQQTLIAAETNDVEWWSMNRDTEGGNKGSDCQYVPAIFDPSTRTLTIHPSTPLYLLSHRVKRLKSGPTDPLSHLEKEVNMYRMKRNDLGETFGTRKAKSQIKAQERNKVNVGAMEGVRGHLMDAIGEKAGEEGPEPPSELIPVPDLTTSDPSHVYSRESIIPSGEWSAIEIDHILQAKDDKSRMGVMPNRRSRWVEEKLGVAVAAAPSIRRTKLKYLYYLSLLQQFNSLSSAIHKLPPSELAGKFPGVPNQLINGLLTRFAEQSGKKYNVTERMKTKLLAWMCVIYLLVDGWNVEVGKVATDLSLPAAKIADMYKTLGCVVEVASPAERERLGISMAEATKAKKATLKAPVKYPKIKRRGPVKR